MPSARGPTLEETVSPEFLAYEAIQANERRIDREACGRIYGAGW